LSLLLLDPPFYPIILFGTINLLTRMTGISMHMRWQSDFSVTWQLLSKRTIGFLLLIKLNALIQLGVSPPSFDTGAQAQN
jgi:hypothetical protein